MKTKRSIAASLLISALMLSSCSAPAPSETTAASQTTAMATETAETTTVATENTETSTTSESTEAVTMTTVELPVDGHHEFQTHVLSDIYKQAYGDGFEEDFFSFCDAFYNVEDSVRLKDRANYVRCIRAARICLPVAYICLAGFDTDAEEKVTDEADNKDGTYKLNYSVSKDEIPALIQNFQTRVNSLIESCCLPDDTPLEKALALYMEESTRISYDFDNAENPNRRLTVYDCLTGDKAICQEIAGAYAYLLLQVGIDATTCSGMDHAMTYGHEWTVVKLGDKYYHCDVTSQTQEKLSLRYFGMTDAKRESENNYDPQYFNFAGINEVFHDDLLIEDETFKQLWDAKYYEIDHKKDMLYCYKESSGEGKPYYKMPLV
ncbi:MAG: transglutaminase domain-containing protein [Clostridiales bacterium]|nr:transglutaminase domain-containing protein [Clostridiales bacterium]